jgi:hypothetical protein
MNIIRISRSLSLLRQRNSWLVACNSRRFKSDPSKEPLKDENIKADLDELTKKLDENLKRKPEDSELELDKKFMSFQRLKEVGFSLNLSDSFFRQLPMNEATFSDGKRFLLLLA